MPVLEQAQRNLGTRGHLQRIVIDRGYLDGEDVWRVQQLGVLFVLVGTSTRTLTQDAQALAKRERAKGPERVVRHGHGKTAREERLRTELVGIEALTTYASYGDPQYTQQAHRRDYEGQPLKAVVVQRGENRLPAADGILYLTKGWGTDPFVVCDPYDWRWVIENGMFKEGKHPWHLGHFPKKTEAAVIVHCHFTRLVMGLCTAFRLWQAQLATASRELTTPQLGLSTALLEGEGTPRWRQRLTEENRDSVIVFLDEVYGIFHLAELAVFSGLRLRRLPTLLGSAHDLLLRYGLSP